MSLIHKKFRFAQNTWSIVSKIFQPHADDGQVHLIIICAVIFSTICLSSKKYANDWEVHVDIQLTSAEEYFIFVYTELVVKMCVCVYEVHQNMYETWQMLWLDVNRYIYDRYHKKSCSCINVDKRRQHCFDSITWPIPHTKHDKI